MVHFYVLNMTSYFKSGSANLGRKYLDIGRNLPIIVTFLLHTKNEISRVIFKISANNSRFEEISGAPNFLPKES